LSGRGLFDELITRPEEPYRLCCVVVCDLETSRMCAPYIYDISRLRVKLLVLFCVSFVLHVLLYPTDIFCTSLLVHTDVPKPFIAQLAFKNFQKSALAANY